MNPQLHTKRTVWETITDQNMSPSTTTRWCPTPEQLMILEELYRRGLRTPSASQIQKITAHLSFYGKIQGKNVFYWFQNHKARDRQKLRKKLAKQLHQQHQQLQHHHLIYQYQLDPRTQFTHSLDFQAPLPFHQQSNCHSTENLLAQGSGVCEEVPEGVMRQTWMPDLPKDCLISTYGHVSTIVDMDPTFPCCRRKPLETLELFPLSSPTANDEKTTS